MYEIIYLKDGKAPSKLYLDRESFVHDFQILEKKGLPCLAQGPSKTGEIVKIARNGWNDDEVVLTVDVDFGSGKKYSYQAGKRYSGFYEVETRNGSAIVSVAYRWRQIDEFRASLWAVGYDEPTLFESILIRKVVG